MSIVMDPDLPQYVNYWILTTSKHDCFFTVGSESGPRERIGAIKIMLMGHSEVLRNMLEEGLLAEKGDISVTDSDPETFLNFLKCIYGGTDVVVRKLPFWKCLKLLYLLEKYLVLDLKNNISKIILELFQPLSVDYAFLAISNVASLLDDNIAKAVSWTVQNHTDQFLKGKLLLKLDLNAFMFIAQQEHLSVKEIDLWKAALKWAQSKVEETDSKDLRSCLGNILKWIRFCTMESKEFCMYVVPTNILTPEEVFEICKSMGTQVPPNVKYVSRYIVDRYQRSSIDITFSHVVNYISAFSDPEYSLKVCSDKFNWSIKVELNEKDKNYLGLFLVCQPINSTPSWKCTASAELVVLNHYGKASFSRSFTKLVFCKKKSDRGYSSFMDWDDLVKLENGYVKHHSIQVIAKVSEFS